MEKVGRGPSSAPREATPEPQQEFVVPQHPHSTGKATMGRLFMVLLWKTYVLRKRRYIISLLEVVVPILMFLGFVYLKNQLPHQKSQITFGTFKNPYQAWRYGADVVAYAPSNEITDQLMQGASKNMWKEAVFVPKNNEAEVVDWLRQFYTNETNAVNNTTPWHSYHLTGVGVIFVDVDNLKSLTYTIRTYIVPLKTTADTIYSSQNGNGFSESGYYLYARSGFLTLQSAIDCAYLSKNNINVTLYNTLTESLPENIATYDFVAILLPLVFLVGFTFAIPSLLRGIVEERSSGIKELMSIMGLKSSVNWAGWMVYTLIVYVPVTFVSTGLLTVDSGSGATINANFMVVWVLFLLFTISTTILVFAISTFFTNGTLAITGTVIIWYVVTNLLNRFFVNNPDEFALWINLLTCLWPPTSLQWCLTTISNFDKNDHPWTLADLFNDGAGGGRVSVGLATLMFFIEMVFYGFVTWYMENVKPGPYGRAKPLTFIFQCFKKKEYDSKSTSLPTNHRNFERPPRGVKIGMKIENLRKTFNNGKVVAVENVDLDIYEGNITALLGHNGAGKTTTMSLLAGMFSPTGGRVIVKDRNIFDHMDDFRSTLGLCPQHNLLFQYFTVLEHLVFFGMLKGLAMSVAQRDGLQLLRTFKIDAKKNDLVSKLSGGMKRKLCLCIALMGDPEVLMLDEPTSGLDPESRRQVWDTLLGLRGTRTTIITTHFMEEADVLGDRIAIMSHGHVSCYGTTIFLKKLYGTGYHLDISKLDHAPVPPITRVIEQYVTTASLKQSLPTQLSFNIKGEESSQFPALFSALDSWRMELGLVAVSISCTTMEDVFLRVSEEPEDEAHSNNDNNNVQLAHKYKKITGFGLVWQQLYALVMKRMLTRFRSWKSTLLFIILPVLLMMWTIKLTVSSDSAGAQPSLKISLDTFPQVQVAVSSDNKAIGSALQSLVAAGNAAYEAIPSLTDFNDYFVQQIKTNVIQYERQMMAGFKVNSSVFVGGYNVKFTHSAPLVLNMMANALLLSNNAGSSITVYNHPIVFQDGQDICTLSLSAQYHILEFPIFVIFISLGLLIILTSFIGFPLKERVSNSKQLQLMTGVSPVLYWLVIFVCDYIMYLITIGLCVASVYVTQQSDIYTSSGYMGLLFGLFALFGLSGIMFAYFFSFIVNSSTKAASVFILINFITGVFVAIFFIFYSLADDDLDIFRHILCLNPSFTMAYAVTNLLGAMYIDGTCNQCGRNCKTEDPLQFYEAGLASTSRYGIRDFIIYLAVDAVLYFLLVMLIEFGVIKKLWFMLSKLWIKMEPKVSEEDSDVLIEKEKVNSSWSVRGYTQNTSVLCVNDLGKKYNRKTTAVHGVSFQVGQGECFGLLGVNGAGKTTTFKMLTGEEVPSKGDANILQCSLQKSKSKFQSRVGYCPQFDAISPLLTGREMLSIYARLRGIPTSHQNYEVSKWIQMMGLKEYENRNCGTYSGGNKRKLCTAMAFIGAPPVVFLDEPTSGVDPVSRRRLWDVVAGCQKTGQAIVLTSHSMEECEALCSRLTIMVGGQMKCIGSSQYLKQKFGQGYTIKIKLFSSSSLQNAVTRLKYDMANQFRDCPLKDEHWGFLHYHVRDASVRLSDLFMKMEHLKSIHDIIEDYIVSDTTLEQVFMSFAQPKTES